MDLIQLMGSPSANRVALGNGGFEGSSESMGLELGEEFAAELKIAFTDGQGKEVNPDGLIAQLVALDLNLGQLPITQVESEQGFAWELSFGQAKGDSVDVDGLVSNEAGAKAISADTVTADETGNRFWGIGAKLDHAGAKLSGYLREPGGLNLKDVQQFIESLPDGELKDSLTAKLEVLTLGNTSRDIESYLTEFFQKVMSTAQSWGFCGVTPQMQGGSDAADLASEETDWRINCEPVERPIRKIDGARTDDATASEQAGYAAGSRMPKSSDNASDSVAAKIGNVGYKGTGQGRPEELGGDFRTRSEISAKPVPIGGEVKNANMTIQEGRVVSLQKAGDFQIDPKALSAPEVIESIAGRLTKESIGLTPKQIPGTHAVATPIEEVVEEAKAVSTEQAEAFGNELMGQDLAKGGISRTDAELAAAVSQDSVAIETEDEEVVFENDLTTSVDDGVDASREVKASEPKPIALDKAAVETAIRNARNEVIQAAIDLAAAKRPQSVKIHLTPFELGTIDVSVRNAGGRVDVDLRASDDAVRQSLAAQRSDLVQSLESKGTTVSSMNVGHHAGQQFGQADGQGGQHATREDFRQAATLGQISTNAEAPAASAPSYGTVQNGRVDLAA